MGADIKRIIGVVIGLAVAIALIDGAWRLAAILFPAPIDPDAATAEMLATYVMRMPAGGKILIVVGWLVAGYVAAFLALRLSQWRPAGWIVGVTIVVLGIWSMTQLAQPWWMLAANVLMPLLGTWLAQRHFHRARPGDPLIG